MTKRLALIAICGLSLADCARRWNPSKAVADADRDIAAHRISFCLIGGFVPTVPGVPEGDAAFRIVSSSRQIPVGPQGCKQDDTIESRYEYARRYNERMWQHVSSQR